jgi:23S rRNA (cytosine1962-C5)-methyltransferase
MMKRRVKAALDKRAAAARKAGKSALFTLVKGEEDGLPGLLVDSYGGPDGFLVCQFQAGGVDAWKVPIVQALIAGTGCPNVYERCDELIRKGEGLPLVSGPLAGEEPPDEVQLTENGVAYAIDLKTGHKSRFR